MAGESDTRIERLGKAYQDTQRQMAKMIEMLRTLVKDKGQATSLGQQSSVVHLDHRREDFVYLPGFTSSYAQTQPIPQMRGFPYGYTPLST